MNGNTPHLQTRLDMLEQQVQQSVQRYQQAERRLKIQAGLAVLVVSAALLLSPANRAALAQTGTLTLQQLAARLSVVEGKTQFMTASSQTRSTVFSGCNLFIQNGLGATNGLPGSSLVVDPTKTRTNGLGNLIVGYNESRSVFRGTDVRTGSHNIIVGAFQNYASYGGLNVGFGNTISGAYDSVSGGTGNVASGFFASVSGGENNTASGGDASVSGGSTNNASGLDTSISGGENNTATGNAASICGGAFGTADGTSSSISGGNGNWAEGGFSSVTGGLFNTASGQKSSVSGGVQNTATAFNSSVSGGINNTASGVNASVSGGTGNTQANRAGWSGGTLHSP